MFASFRNKSPSSQNPTSETSANVNSTERAPAPQPTGSQWPQSRMNHHNRSNSSPTQPRQVYPKPEESKVEESFSGVKVNLVEQSHVSDGVTLTKMSSKNPSSGVFSNGLVRANSLRTPRPTAPVTRKGLKSQQSNSVLDLVQLFSSSDPKQSPSSQNPVSEGSANVNPSKQNPGLIPKRSKCTELQMHRFGRSNSVRTPRPTFLTRNGLETQQSSTAVGLNLVQMSSVPGVSLSEKSSSSQNLSSEITANVVPLLQVPAPKPIHDKPYEIDHSDSLEHARTPRPTLPPKPQGLGANVEPSKQEPASQPKRDQSPPFRMSHSDLSQPSSSTTSKSTKPTVAPKPKHLEAKVNPSEQTPTKPKSDHLPWDRIRNSILTRSCSFRNPKQSSPEPEGLKKQRTSSVVELNFSQEAKEVNLENSSLPPSTHCSSSPPIASDSEMACVLKRLQSLPPPPPPLPPPENLKKKYTFKQWNLPDAGRNGDNSVFHTRAEIQKKAENLDISSIDSMIAKQDNTTGKLQKKKKVTEQVKFTRVLDITSAIREIGDNQQNLIDGLQNHNLLMITERHCQFLKHAVPNKEEEKQFANGGKIEGYEAELEARDWLEAFCRKLPNAIVLVERCSFMNDIKEFYRWSTIVDKLFDALLETRSSLAFQGALNVVLVLAEKLNEGRGTIHGFEMSALKTIKDLPTKNPNQIGTHVVAQLVAAQFPELLDFPSQLRGLKAASKIDYADLRKEMTKYVKKFENLQTCEEPSVATFIHEHRDRMKVKYDKVLTWNKEFVIVRNRFESSKAGYQSFFGDIADFAAEFQKCHEENLAEKAQKTQ